MLDTINTKTCIKSKILIIDDDEIIRNSMSNMIKKILSKLEIEYELIEGADGSELIDLVNDDIKNEIKIIFTDENMPQCEGSDAIRRLMTIIEKNKINVISVTANEDETSISKLLSCGIDEVIKKPVHISTLERIINDYIG